MGWINDHQQQIIETSIVVAILLVLNFIIRKSSTRIAKKFNLGIERRRITGRMINLLFLIVGALSVMGIWGLDKKELFVFLTSVLTVLGIAFFANWSLLSNITAGLILYFNHPLHIGDYIKIIEKENPVEGKIIDISLFFVHIKTTTGEHITLPNSAFTQKTISVISNFQEDSAQNNS